MGIRPSIYILVGIDDAVENDSRRIPHDKELLDKLMNYSPMTEEEMYRDDDSLVNDYMEWKHKIPGVSRWLYDRVFVFDNVVGYVISRSEYDSQVLRALATFDSKYISTGVDRIPTLDVERHKGRYVYSGYTYEDVKCNRFVDGVFESSPSMSRIQWKRAQHYLKYLGWNIPETDLRYLLAWDWSYI